MTNSVNKVIEEKLSKDLVPVFRFQLELGNSVARVDSPAGMNCPYALILKNKINHREIEKHIKLNSRIRKWKNTDPHYDRESGYFCETTNHAIACPIKSTNCI